VQGLILGLEDAAIINWSLPLCFLPVWIYLAIIAMANIIVTSQIFKYMIQNGMPRKYLSVTAFTAGIPAIWVFMFAFDFGTIHDDYIDCRRFFPLLRPNIVSLLEIGLFSQLGVIGVVFLFLVMMNKNAVSSLSAVVRFVYGVPDLEGGKIIPPAMRDN
jgi:hypothetical protein